MGANVVIWIKLVLLRAGWGSEFRGNEWCHTVPTCVEHDKTIGSPCSVISDTPYCAMCKCIPVSPDGLVLATFHCSLLMEIQNEGRYSKSIMHDKLPT